MRKKLFSKKKEKQNRNVNLTAAAKESEYTIVVVSERQYLLTVVIIAQTRSPKTTSVCFLCIYRYW